MSDPLRSDLLQPANASVEPDKEARIEQLLLAGLDHYFAGQHEQAINVWTRVVFLERGHDRARAYIERARGALAEKHRESEELLYRGIAAFNNGDTTTARDLITKAVEQGGPQDVALVLLERLNRLAAPAPVDPPRPVGLEQQPKVDDTPRAWTASWWVRGAAAVAIVAGAFAALVLSGMRMPDWLADPVGSPREEIAVPPVDPLPIARSSERILARARSLQGGGHLQDALKLLDGIGPADPMRAEADRVRADVQRRLLETGRATLASVPKVPR
jgi:hypothetical protein